MTKVQIKKLPLMLFLIAVLLFAVIALINENQTAEAANGYLGGTDGIKLNTGTYTEPKNHDRDNPISAGGITVTWHNAAGVLGPALGEWPAGLISNIECYLTGDMSNPGVKFVVTRTNKEAGNFNSDSEFGIGKYTFNFDGSYKYAGSKGNIDIKTNYSNSRTITKTHSLSGITLSYDTPYTIYFTLEFEIRDGWGSWAKYSGSWAYNFILREQNNYSATFAKSSDSQQYQYGSDYYFSKNFTLNYAENPTVTTQNTSFTVTGATEGGTPWSTTYSTNPTVIYTQPKTIVTVNGQTTSSGKTFSTEGKYDIVVKNVSGVIKKNYTVYIDKTAPDITLSCANYGFAKDNVSVTVQDNRYILSTKYGTNTMGVYPSSATSSISTTASPTVEWTASGAGNYRVTATDLVGNATTKYFTIDKTAPVLTLSGVTSGGFTNGSGVTVSWGTDVGKIDTQRVNTNDAVTVKYSFSTSGTFPAQATKTAANGTTFTDAGNYIVTISDKAGNSTSYTFTIDRTAPTLSIAKVANNLTVANNGFSNSNVKLSWDTASNSISAQKSNARDDLTVKYSVSTTASFPTIANTIYSQGTALTASGNYLVTISDRAGNSTSYNFTIDKTAPVLTLSGVTNGGFTNGSGVSATWTTNVGGVGAALTNKNDVLTVRYAVSSDGNFPTSTTNVYTKKLTEEGNYLLVISDKAGNSTSYTFTIDLTPPTLTLSNVSERGITKNNVSLVWNTTVGGAKSQKTNINDALIVKYALSTTGTFPANVSTDYSSGELSAEGNYLVTITDKAGNSSSYRFTIDKTAPVLTLSDVANGDITNKNVFVSWSTNIGGVGSQLIATEDTLSVKYSVSTVEGFPINATTVYSKGQELAMEGNYLLVISDKAGNSTSYKFIIDKTAPMLTLSGVANGGFTKNNVSATWNNNVGGVGSQRVSDDDSVTARYAISATSSFPTVATTNYVANNKLSAEGNYLLVISDKAGNSTSYTFTIDRTAPMLTLSGVANGGITNQDVAGNWSTVINGVQSQLTNSSDSVNVLYGYDKTQMPNTAVSAYSKNVVLTTEGNYLLVISDKAGNSTSYTFSIDKTAPTVSAPGRFVNADFEFAATDLHGVRIEYQHNGSETKTVNDGIVSVIAQEENYGVWSFRALDDANNATDWYEINLLLMEGFGNKNAIINSYYVPQWNNVSLPTSIFGSDSGTYSFGSYDEALKFASDMEWKYRVRELDNGAGWSYISEGNANVYIQYDNIDDLNAVVEFYAATYISDTNVFGTNKTLLTTANGYSVYDVLTKNYPVTNEICPVLHKSYIFTAPNKVLNNNTFTLTAQYIHNGLTSVESNEVKVEYGASLAAAYGISLRQGFYRINETDAYGNVDSYIVYVDLEAPILNAVADGNDITFTQDYIKQYDGLFSYSNFNFSSFTDNADKYAAIKINGRGLDNVSYLLDENWDLPVLTYENGYFGRYTISVYDRSGNVAVISLAIAGQPPEITTSSLSNTSRLTVTITMNDPTNALTQINICKINYDGSETLFEYDDVGTKIAVSNLVYVLTNGGHYRVEAVDIYNRKVEYSFFYRKGLPTGVLNGVEEGGITSRNVTLTYNTDCSVELYEWIDDEWQDVSDKAWIETNVDSLVALLEAVDGRWAKFKWFLYNTADRSLFIEYEFSMKCVMPQVIVSTTSGAELSDGSLTKENFSLTWEQEDIKVMVEQVNNKFAGTTEYTKGTVLSRAATYLFTVTDSVKNKIEITVTLDNKIDFTMEGNYKNCNGTLTSKYWFRLTANEETRVFELTSATGNSYVSGTRIEEEGLYYARIIDLAGNELQLKIAIDRTAPNVSIVTSDGAELAYDSVTNQSVTLSTEQGATITYTYLGTNNVYDGGLLEGEGRYSFVVSDAIGNMSEFTLRIKKTLTYTVSGKYVQDDGKYISGNWLRIEEDVDFAAVTIRNSAGVLFGVGTRLTAEDTYVATIVDIAGNKQTLTLVIDLTPPTASIITESGNYLDYGVITNQNFTVACEEPNVTISYILANESKQYRGEILSQEGRYDFTISDIVGNISTFRVTVKKSLQYTVSGKYVQDGSTYISANWLRLEQDEMFSTVVIVERTAGTVFTSGDKIENEGEYVVSIEDIAGNMITLWFVIDKTAPIAVITTTDGTQLPYDGITNQNFTVSCEENGSRITQRINETDLLYDGSELSEEGVYIFTVSDRVGNANTFKVTIRKTLTYTLTGSYIEHNGRFISNNWMRLEPDEMFSTVSIVSANGGSYQTGERLTEEDVYYVSILDVAGNLINIVLEIDKTAPTFSVVAEDDSMIAANGATNSNFRVVVDEQDVIVAVSFNRGGSSIYSEELISEEGAYVFTITDIVGNAVSFTMLLSKQLLFTVSGNYVLDGERYISANWLRLEQSDNFASVSIIDGNGIEYKAGQRIDVEGSYYVNISDVAGNTVSFVMEIDKTAPNVQILTSEGVELAINSATNKSFTLTAQEENSTVVCSFEGSTFEYEGELLIKEGVYIFTVSDRVGNAATFTVQIILHLDYNVSGAVLMEGNRYISNYWLRLEDSELFSEVVIIDENGSTYSVGSRIDAEGVYYVTIIDIAGNSEVIELEIDKTAPNVYIQTVDGTILEYLLTNQEVVVLCDEEGSIIKRMYEDGEELYYGQAVSEEGAYQFVVYDRVGNSQIVTLRIKKTLTFAVTGYALLEENRYISNNWLYIDNVSDLKEISIVGINGQVMDASKRIIDEGVYIATITDLAGNSVSIELEIDKTPPEIAILTESGLQLSENSVINQPFSVRTDEKAVAITCTMDSGEEITEYTLFSKEGTYRFVIKDRLGNTKEFTVRIKTTLEYTITGKYVKEDDTYSSASWLLVESDKDLANVIISNETKTYGIGDRVDAEGVYVVHIEDIAGNTAALTFVIDKTAPDCTIKNENGVVLNSGAITNQSVSVESKEEDVSITYTLKNGTPQDYKGLIADEGRYTVVVQDKVGNQSTATFTIDKTVAVQGIVKTGQIYSDNATITFSEDVTTKMTFNGEVMEYPRSGRFSADGKYTLMALDSYGNSETWEFEIVRKNCQTFTHDIAGFDITVTLDGEQIPIEDVSEDGVLALTSTGNYLLVYSMDGAELFTLELSVHNTPPPLEYECDGRSASAKVAVKGNYTVSLFKDGKQVSYELGNVIKNNGNYTLIVTDEYGNSSECTFEINYLNGFGIAVIVIICVLLLVVVVLLIRSRRIKVR